MKITTFFFFGSSPQILQVFTLLLIILHNNNSEFLDFRFFWFIFFAKLECKNNKKTNKKLYRHETFFISIFVFVKKVLLFQNAIRTKNNKSAFFFFESQNKKKNGGHIWWKRSFHDEELSFKWKLKGKNQGSKRSKDSFWYLCNHLKQQ